MGPDAQDDEAVAEDGEERDQGEQASLKERRNGGAKYIFKNIASHSGFFVQY